MTRALLQQSLEALLWYERRWLAQSELPLKFSNDAIEAITAALAQPEPVDDGMCRSCINGLCVTGSECVTLGRDSAALPAPDADEDEALRNRLAYLLAGVAVALKGPEPALTRWSYADLPEIAAKAMIELEIYRQQAGPDRQDAQRYRYLTSGKLSYFTATSILNDSIENIHAAIDAAIATGGQQ
jgi:hypothetical protein